MIKFRIGDRVKPANAKSYASDRRGVVVEVTDSRVRVQWEKQANGVAAKRTWMQPKSLMLVVTAGPQPAVGPGGWCLDTSE